MQPIEYRALREELGIDPGELAREIRRLGGRASRRHILRVEAGSKPLTSRLAEQIERAIQAIHKRRTERLKGAHFRTFEPVS